MKMSINTHSFVSLLYNLFPWQGKEPSEGQSWCSTKSCWEGQAPSAADCTQMVISSWQWQQLGKAARLQQAVPELEAETPWPKPCQHADLIRPDPAANSCYPRLERGDESGTESSDITSVVTAQALP